jgi:hypothetical protein
MMPFYVDWLTGLGVNFDRLPDGSTVEVAWHKAPEPVRQKATELGVSEILVFNCERSIGHPSPQRHARWQRIARGAMKQLRLNESLFEIAESFAA